MPVVVASQHWVTLNIHYGMDVPKATCMWIESSPQLFVGGFVLLFIRTAVGAQSVNVNRMFSVAPNVLCFDVARGAH